MLGLPNGIVRFAALYKGTGDIKKIKGTLCSAFVISIMSSIAVGGLLLLSRPLSEMFHMSELVKVLRIFAFAFPFYVITLMTGTAAKAFQEIKYKAHILSRQAANPLDATYI